MFTSVPSMGKRKRKQIHVKIVPKSTPFHYSLNIYLNGPNKNAKIMFP